MPRKDGRFTPQERVFIDRMVATDDAVYAAEKAGYGTPARRASQALQNPAIVAAIRAEQEARLTGELVPLTLDRFGQALRDPKTTPREVAAIGRVVLQYGLGDRAAEPPDPSRMTPDEIRARMAQLAEVIAELKRPLIEGEATPVDGVFE